MSMVFLTILPIFVEIWYGRSVNPTASPVATETPAPRGRGRPRTFDDDTVLDAAIELFWAKGFEAASITDLVEATGLNKSSLYNAYGSKNELFERAVKRYCEIKLTMLGSILEQSTGLDALAAMFTMMRAEVASDAGRRGCLAVNISTELGFREAYVTTIATSFRSSMRELLTDALEQAAAGGEIDADKVGPYAEVLLAFSLGLAVMARSGATADEFDRQFAAAGALVESWRLDDRGTG